MLILSNSKKIKFITILNFVLLYGCMDRVINIGKVENTTTRNLFVVLVEKDSVVNDKFIYIVSPDCLVKPLSTSKIYMMFLPDREKNFKWSYYFFDHDTLRKYFLNQPIPDVNSMDVTKKAFLKKVYVYQSEFDNRSISLRY